MELTTGQAATGTPIPGLRGGSVHRLAIEVRQRHRDGGSGLCRCCGNPAPCAPLGRATEVLRAAGEEPGVEPARTCAETVGVRQSRSSPEPAGPEIYGFSITGRTRMPHPAGYAYEREST